MSMQPTPQTPEVAARRTFWLGLGILTLCRAAIAASMPLSGEEAYYWIWSRHLELCYYDHPPLVAWVIRLCSTILGHSAFAVRAAPIAAHTVSAIVVYHAVRRMVRDTVAAAWAGLVFTVTFYFAATATIAIPDGILFACWSLTTWFVLEAIAYGKRRLWLLVGLGMGLCALAKFHAILLAMSAGIFLLASPRQRKLFRSGWLYAGAAVALLMTLPIIVWNHREGWPTFAFQLAGRHKFVLGNPIYIMEMLVTPFGLMGPLLFPLGVTGVAWGFRKGIREGDDRCLWLAVSASVPYIFFLALSAFIKIDPQWSAPAFIPAVVLAALAGVGWMRDPAAKGWRRNALRWTLLLHVAVIGLIYTALVCVIAFPAAVPNRIHLAYPGGHRKKIALQALNEFYGWDQIGRRVRSEIASLGGEKKAFILVRAGWATASSLAFHAGGKIRAYTFDNSPATGHQFHLWERRLDADEMIGMNAIVVGTREEEMHLESLRHCFERLEEVAPEIIVRGGRERRRWLLVRAWNMRRMPVDEDEGDRRDPPHRVPPRAEEVGTGAGVRAQGTGEPSETANEPPPEDGRYGKSDSTREGT